MEELKKIERTITSKIPGTPHETLMGVDATTGQNALSQAQLFNESIKISGNALTKLDGTAKGGIVIGITNSLNVPLRYNTQVGVSPANPDTIPRAGTSLRKIPKIPPALSLIIKYHITEAHFFIVGWAKPMRAHHLPPIVHLPCIMIVFACLTP